jgi:SAM-dependent methyltransferase
MNILFRLLGPALYRLVPPARRADLRRMVRRLAHPAWMGTIRRTTPLSEHWGTERGTPIDRYYIARFLSGHRADIRGRVLEVKDSTYTTRFGSDLTAREVLDIDPANPAVTIVADLAAADAIPDGAFDCFVLTQTLQYIYDPPAALRHAHRILRPGGVLLLTVPGLTRLAPPLTDYWHFTPGGCARLLEELFGAGRVIIYVYGNVLTATAFLTGMAADELRTRELAASDRRYPVIIAARAVKASDAQPLVQKGSE